MILKGHLTGVQIAVRASASAAISFALAQMLGLQYPVFAFIAAVIVTDLSPSLSRQLGWRRIVSTVIGAITGALLSQALPPGPLGLGVSVLVAMLICEVLRAQEGAKVAGYICGVIVFDHAADPWGYAYARFIETALGVVVAWSISYVPKLIRSGDEDKPA